MAYGDHHLCFYRPAHLRWSGTSILSAFLSRRSDHIFGIIRINSFFVSLVQCFLYQFVFSGMEGKDCHTSAWFQSSGEFFHKIIENLEFPVYIDTQRLENPLACFFDRVFFLFFRKKIQRIFDNSPQFCCAIDAIPFADLICDRFCDLFAIRINWNFL